MTINFQSYGQKTLDFENHTKCMTLNWPLNMSSNCVQSVNLLILHSTNWDTMQTFLFIFTRSITLLRNQVFTEPVYDKSLEKN